MREIEVSRKITMSTVRLQTENSTGTGFFYSYYLNDREFIPTIVTNKHVLKNAKQLSVTFTCTKDNNLIKEDYVINNLHEIVVYHPNENVDLAIIPIISILQHFKQKVGYEPELIFLDSTLLPSKRDIELMKTIENVLVVGYPNGLWDKVNSRPLVRGGITASDYKVNYEGESIFIIDSAIYPGSSGSPVFLVSEGMKSDGLGNYSFANPSVKLLGINSAVFTQGVKGEIVQTKIGSLSKIPIGLGIIIKSENLNEFKKIFLDRLKMEVS